RGHCPPLVDEWMVVRCGGFAASRCAPEAEVSEYALSHRFTFKVCTLPGGSMSGIVVLLVLFMTVETADPDSRHRQMSGLWISFVLKTGTRGDYEFRGGSTRSTAPGRYVRCADCQGVAPSKRR